MVMETMKKSLPYLSLELIIQILLRLPVKSLIRFKCVCKSWFSLISDTHFANSHFQLNAATHIHRVLFISTVSPHETRSIDLEASHSLNNDSAVASLNPNFMPSERFSHIEIKGSCRGFILLHWSSSLYLWNPTTGVHKNIPFGSNLDAYDEFFYGFGYDQSTDDYLVVSMSANISSPPLLLKNLKRKKVSPQLEIFSLRANTWKEIDGPHAYYENSIEDAPFSVMGALFNGAIHWLAYRPDLGKDVIVGFDLTKRKLLDMNLPDEFDRVPRNCGLWVFREFLSLWAMDYDNDTVEIWVMKEYKVQSSWTKTHVLHTDAIPNKYFSPLSSTKSGDIVGTDGHIGFVKYNDEGQLLGHHSYCDDPYGSHAAMYTESLLSLPGDNVQA